MSPSTSTAATPQPTPIASVAAASADVKDRARQRVASLLASGTAGLRSVDRRLEALAARDWSISALAKELEGVAQKSSAAIEKRARARLRQLDHLPVDAAAATIGRSRTAVKAVSTALQRAARKVAGEPAPAASTH